MKSRIFLWETSGGSRELLEVKELCPFTEMTDYQKRAQQADRHHPRGITAATVTMEGGGQREAQPVAALTLAGHPMYELPQFRYLLTCPASSIETGKYCCPLCVSDNSQKKRKKVFTFTKGCDYLCHLAGCKVEHESLAGEGGTEARFALAFGGRIGNEKMAKEFCDRVRRTPQGQLVAGKVYGVEQICALLVDKVMKEGEETRAHMQKLMQEEHESTIANLRSQTADIVNQNEDVIRGAVTTLRRTLTDEISGAEGRVHEHIDGSGHHYTQKLANKLGHQIEKETRQTFDAVKNLRNEVQSASRQVLTKLESVSHGVAAVSSTLGEVARTTTELKEAALKLQKYPWGVPLVCGNCPIVHDKAAVEDLLIRAPGCDLGTDDFDDVMGWHCDTCEELNKPCFVDPTIIAEGKGFLVLENNVGVDEKAVQEFNQARSEETGRMLKVGDHEIAIACPVCFRDFEPKSSTNTDAFPVAQCSDFRHVVCMKCELRLQTIARQMTHSSVARVTKACVLCKQQWPCILEAELRNTNCFHNFLLEEEENKKVKPAEKKNKKRKERTTDRSCVPGPS